MDLKALLGESWEPRLGYLFQKQFMLNLFNGLRTLKARNINYVPNGKDAFANLRATPFDLVKVVLIMPEPYSHLSRDKTPYANGFALGTNVENQPPPKELQAVFTEIGNTLYDNIYEPHTYNLYSWAKQGVLLLNETWTVTIGKPKSHQGVYWSKFTEMILREIADKGDPVAVVGFGESANLLKYAKSENTYCIAAPYPTDDEFLSSDVFYKVHNFIDLFYDQTIKW